MIVTVCCKASTNVGLGHLIRSHSFANQVTEYRNDVQLNYILIGEDRLRKLIQKPRFRFDVYESEALVSEIPASDVVVLDMTDIGINLLDQFKRRSRSIASLSPVFNHFDKIDFLFNRTKYIGFDQVDFPNLRIFAGFEYAVISENCRRINAGTFEQNLDSTHFPIGIIMGGGDATNKTLNVLNALKKCGVPATFWVMLGEGYKHSLDSLVDEIRLDTFHEIILAKTNKSMWRILDNCILCITSGGVTSFEAVYAGLPAINFFEKSAQQFLLAEILEHNAAYDIGVYSPETLDKLSQFIEQLYANKHQLLQMHINSKSLLDNRGAIRIFEELAK